MEEKYLFLLIIQLLSAIYVYSLAGYRFLISNGRQFISGIWGPDNDKIILCYYTSWTTYRSGGGKFEVSNIEPSLCTHLVYSYAGLDDSSNKIKVLDTWQDLERNGGGFRRFVDLKEKHTHLKTIISIGGWNEGSTKYSKMAHDPDLRKIFVRSVVDFLDVHKFDGLDIFWEYPTGRGGKPEDRMNYVSLIKELSEAFEPKNYILSGTLRTSSKDIDSLYDLVQVNFYLDFIHLMTYEYHGSWDGVVGPIAPLRSKNEKDFLNVENRVKYLLSHGLTANKMIFGLVTYGRTYILNNPSVKDIVFGETTTKKTGFVGPFSGDKGYIGFNEICLELSNKSSEWVQYWHEDSRTPYLRDDDRVISYENPRSVANKVQLAMNYSLGGFAVWNIPEDNFGGNCDENTDTYKDYMERFNTMAQQRIFQEAIASLIAAGHDNKFYTIINKKARLRLPKPKFPNYPLLRTVHDAMDLVAEEKKVLDEVERLKVIEKEIAENNFPCVRTCTEVCYYGSDNTPRKTIKTLFGTFVVPPKLQSAINQISVSDANQ